MHYFIFGPSGVGKTTFGDWVEQNCAYHHLRIDCGDEPMGADAVTAFGLLQEGNGDALVKFLDECAGKVGKSGCMLTFWSGAPYGAAQIPILAGHGIVVRYLYGPREKCVEAFTRREAAAGHPEREETFWSRFNQEYGVMGDAALAPYRIEVFDPSGNRLPPEEIARQMKIT